MFNFPDLCLLLTLASAVTATNTSCPALRWRPHHEICPGPPHVFVVTNSPGKGLGVFAAHDLEIGDIIMRETPVIKILPPVVEKGSPYPMSIISSRVREQFNELSTEAQEDVLSLTYHTNSRDQANADKLGIIFRTNAYNTGKQIGLFPKIARINHACRPNLSYYWNESLNKRIVYATRPIKKGEEIFVSYISLLQTREKRQKTLERYGFRCTCEACAQGQTAVRTSDERRLAISKGFNDIEPELKLTPLSSKKGMRQARQNAHDSIKIIQLLQEEGLADYYAKAYRVAAITHARIRDWQNAAVWANKGYEIRFREDPKSSSTIEMHQLALTFIASWEEELGFRS